MSLPTATNPFTHSNKPVRHGDEIQCIIPCTCICILYAYVAQRVNVPALSVTEKKKISVKKGTAEKDVTKKAEKPVMTEVVRIPIGKKSTISKGPVHSAVKKSGYIANITYFVRWTLSSSYKTNFIKKYSPLSKAMVQIQFLKTDNNVLVSVSLPFGEHTRWSGLAVSALAGQGALYCS